MMQIQREGLFFLFFICGSPSFISENVRMSELCVSWETERLLCHPALSLCPRIRKRANGTGDPKEEKGRRRRRQRRDSVCECSSTLPK